MSEWLSLLSRRGFTQICAVHGTVSLPGEGDGAGKIQLWYHMMLKEYRIYASKTDGDDRVVCELLMFDSENFVSSNLLKTNGTI